MERALQCLPVRCRANPAPFWSSMSLLSGLCRHALDSASQAEYAGSIPFIGSTKPQVDATFGLTPSHKTDPF